MEGAAGAAGGSSLSHHDTGRRCRLRSGSTRNLTQTGARQHLHAAADRRGCNSCRGPRASGALYYWACSRLQCPTHKPALAPPPSVSLSLSLSIPPQSHTHTHTHPPSLFTHTPQARHDSVRPVVTQRVRFCLMRTARAAGCDPALALRQLRRGPFGTGARRGYSLHVRCTSARCARGSDRLYTVYSAYFPKRL